jgi:hypothetical protein
MLLLKYNILITVVLSRIEPVATIFKLTFSEPERLCPN